MIAETRLQIRSNTIIQYTKYDRKPLSRLLKGKKPDNFQKQTYSGNLSSGAKKRLLKAVELIIMSAPQKTRYNPALKRDQNYSVTFITLTIHSPDYMVLSKEGHKNLLEPFLKWMRQVHGCKMYVWKAELQQRGMIHYHIVSDCFIINTEIQKKWNDLQRKHGYLNEYYRVHGHYNAPSVDVGAMKHGAAMSQYIMKEITKSCQNTAPVGGKVWDCSLNIKANTYFTTSDQHCRQFLSEQVAKKNIEAVYGDHFIIYKLSDFGYKTLGFRDKVAYMDMLNGIREHSRSYYNNITDLDSQKRQQINAEFEVLTAHIDKKPPPKVTQLPLFLS